MDIGKNSSGLASRLSNFTPRPFIFDGVECASMEGLLQAFKFDKEHIQIEVCKLTGLKAKRRGSKRNKAWKRIQTLWWKGVAYPRRSEEYQQLLERAFDALATNQKFRKDLIASGNCSFTHSIGKNNPADTVLTVKEFCGNLYRVRDSIN